MSENGYIPPRMEEIIEDFQMCVGQEKLMYLLELSEELPDLPDWLSEKRDQMEQVHECMSPVFLHAEKEEGKMQYYFDIPPEAPTVRGYGAILSQSLNGETPENILRIPNDFYLKTGLQEVITGQRINGMSAILAYMKRLATEKLSNLDSE